MIAQFSSSPIITIESASHEAKWVLLAVVAKVPQVIVKTKTILESKISGVFSMNKSVDLLLMNMISIAVQNLDFRKSRNQTRFCPRRSLVEDENSVCNLILI